jgi:hypothetical protein
MLGVPYTKFIYILTLMLNKINKKILSFIFKFYDIKRVNQQETTAYAEGSSETTRDITYNFNEYFYLLPEHKKKINSRFLE